MRCGRRITKLSACGLGLGTWDFGYANVENLERGQSVKRNVGVGEGGGGATRNRGNLKPKRAPAMRWDADRGCECGRIRNRGSGIGVGAAASHRARSGAAEQAQAQKRRRQRRARTGREWKGRAEQVGAGGRGPRATEGAGSREQRRGRTRRKVYEWSTERRSSGSMYSKATSRTDDGARGGVGCEDVERGRGGAGTAAGHVLGVCARGRAACGVQPGAVRWRKRTRNRAKRRGGGPKARTDGRTTTRPPRTTMTPRSAGGPPCFSA